ncbi:MAG: UTP--glucose-1-phosphate uridylyltransferase, partial [bacterium]|nr:UTP--glucose-1-phosphate uridylyltransferase [bacterium]
MSEAGLAAARAKMQEAGVSEAAIEVFSSYYAQLESGATGLIREADIEPLTEVDQLPELDPAGEPGDPGTLDATALGQTVLIRLNGG